MSKSGQQPAKADVGGQRPKTPDTNKTPEEGVPPQAAKTLPPSPGKSGAKKG